MRTAPIRYWFVVFGTQTIAALLILGVCIWQWHFSWIPVALFLGFSVLPLLFYASIGALGMDPTKKKNAIVSKDAPPPLTRVAIATMPILLGGLLGTGLILSFWSPEVRILVIKEAAAMRIELPSENALWDMDVRVRHAACQAISEHSADVSSPVLLDALSSRDELIPCIMPALTMGSEHPILNWRQSEWFGQLMHGDEDGPHMCEMASYLFHAERVGAPSALSQLFTCAAGAKAGAARECCVQSLVSISRGADIVQFLPSPEFLLQTDFAQHAPLYIQAAFSEGHELDRLGGAPLETWAMELGCRAILGQTHPFHEIQEPFRAAVHTPNCTPPPINQQTLGTWRKTCGDWIETTRPPAEMCPQLNHDLIEMAFKAARRGVDRAYPISFFPGGVYNVIPWEPPPSRKKEEVAVPKTPSLGWDLNTILRMEIPGISPSQRRAIEKASGIDSKFNIFGGQKAPSGD